MINIYKDSERFGKGYSIFINHYYSCTLSTIENVNTEIDRILHRNSSYSVNWV